jgi:Zn-dependent protease
MAAFGRSVTILRVSGIPVRVHASWLVIFVLLTWSLATGWFPARRAGLAVETYWAMGVLGSLGLFVSILLHELSHSFVARHRGLPIKDITLFIFGGVAQMTEEPEDPNTEFWMAVAGPVASVVIALGFWSIVALSRTLTWPAPVADVAEYLAVLNILLVLFNMVPAMPLDGGRVLRALLWKWRGDPRMATRVTSELGALFGAFLIALGVVSIVTGNVIGGIWFGVIGLFLRGAAQMGFQQMMVKELLEGETVRGFTNTEVVTVAPGLTLHDLVEHFVYRYHHKAYPVVLGGALLGIVGLDEIKGVPRERWSQVYVADVLVPPTEANTIHPDEEAIAGLKRITETGQPRLLVVEYGRLVGLLSLRDLMDLFQLKAELSAR